MTRFVCYGSWGDLLSYRHISKRQRTLPKINRRGTSLGRVRLELATSARREAGCTLSKWWCNTLTTAGARSAAEAVPRKLIMGCARSRNGDLVHLERPGFLQVARAVVLPPVDRNAVCRVRPEKSCVIPKRSLYQCSIFSFFPATVSQHVLPGFLLSSTSTIERGRKCFSISGLIDISAPK